jgi:hypothetical protein
MIRSGLGLCVPKSLGALGSWNLAVALMYKAGIIPWRLAFPKKVGEILKLAGDREPALHYRYYM